MGMQPILLKSVLLNNVKLNHITFYAYVLTSSWMLPTLLYRAAAFERFATRLLSITASYTDVTQTAHRVRGESGNTQLS